MKKSSVTTDRERKRDEAILRQNKYDKLSHADKLARIADKPGQSLRELARLLK